MTATHHGRNLSGSTADWVLREYETTEPLTEEELPESDRHIIANEINAGKQDRIKMVWLPDGRVRLKATQYVGVLSLPGGLSIEIRPKVPGTNLLELLQYSQGIRADTIAEETEISRGREFIHALATLFEAELGDVLQRGLTREYRRQSNTEQHVRGRLEVQRQLQHQGPQPTQFECTYDELTADTLLNRSILFATTVLLRLLENGRVSGALQRHKQILQRQVPVQPVRPVELEQVELSRLADHYEDIVRLTILVLRGIYADDLQSGTRSSFSLLVNMNDIFEQVVERAIQDAFEDTRMTVRSQHTSHNLAWEGARPIKIQPDILIQDGDEIKFVGDAKWKVDGPDSREPSNSDIYQLISYQVAHDVPGALFYPAQDREVASVYESQLEHPLSLIEIPTASAEGETYPETVEQSLSGSLTF